MATTTPTTPVTITNQPPLQPRSLLDIARTQPRYLQAVAKVGAEGALPYNLVNEERCKDIHLVIKFDMVECFENALKHSFLIVDDATAESPIINGPFDEVDDMGLPIPEATWTASDPEFTYELSDKIEAALKKLTRERNPRIIQYISDTLPLLLDRSEANLPGSAATKDELADKVWQYMSNTIYGGLAQVYFRILLDMGATESLKPLLRQANAANKYLASLQPGDGSSEYEYERYVQNLRFYDPIKWLGEWAIENADLERLKIALVVGNNDPVVAESWVEHLRMFAQNEDFAKAQVRPNLSTYWHIGRALDAALTPEQRTRKTAAAKTKYYQTWQSVLAEIGQP